jgi:drug/metabolite transporter (DMT)-like permease
VPPLPKLLSGGGTQLGFKVGLLTTLFGPAAGGFAVLLPALMTDPTGEIWRNPSILPAVFSGVLLGAYVLGTLPALAAGVAWGTYVGNRGRYPWLVGLAVGSVLPPSLLLLFSLDGPHPNGGLYELAATAVLGFAAAAITQTCIFLILRRAQTRAAASQPAQTSS